MLGLILVLVMGNLSLVNMVRFSQFFPGQGCGTDTEIQVHKNVHGAVLSPGLGSCGLGIGIDYQEYTGKEAYIFALFPD